MGSECEYPQQLYVLAKIVYHNFEQLAMSCSFFVQFLIGKVEYISLEAEKGTTFKVVQEVSIPHRQG